MQIIFSAELHPGHKLSNFKTVYYYSKKPMNVTRVCYKLQHSTFVRTSEKVDSLLISTRLSQVMSRIQRKGLGSTAFRSSEAPPV
jgi:hypothetical protein